MIKRFLLRSLILIIPVYILSGCMMSGMHMGRKDSTNKDYRIKQLNEGELLDDVITEAVDDLVLKSPDLNSLAVWRLQSQTSGVDNEVIREKLITQLVNTRHYSVVSRQRLQEILAEQSLKLSGIIDESNAVKMGALIGVEGFIDGFTFMKKNRFILNLKLIETKTGVIVWAKTVEREL